MPIHTQVLVLSKEPELLNAVSGSFTTQHCEVTALENGQDPLNRLRGGISPTLVLIDLADSHSDGLQNLQRIKAEFPQIKLIAICSSEGARVAVAAMRLGAADCLVRPFSRTELQEIASKYLGPTYSQLEKKDYSEAEDLGGGYCMVISSPEMQEIRSYCSFIAKVDLPVLIVGESGTGKEVIARLVHKISPRAKHPFLKVNCAAVPADLLESELFGYEPGAFTGATHAKPGKFEQCNKGIIFLDEIGEMHPSLQAKLLHVLQDQQFSRLGGRHNIKVDVRVVAATNININEALANRKLREDLYYRLNTFVVRMPPLRERKGEISFLLQHFANQLARQWGTPPMPLSPAITNACMRYSWPGNIRELENFAKRWQLLRDEQNAIAELATLAKDPPAASVNFAATKPLDGVGISRKADRSVGKLRSVARSAVEEAESAAISEALARTRWNRKRAAELLEISYKALLYKIKQYDLERVVAVDAAASQSTMPHASGD